MTHTTHFVKATFIEKILAVAAPVSVSSIAFKFLAVVFIASASVFINNRIQAADVSELNAIQKFDAANGGMNGVKFLHFVGALDDRQAETFAVPDGAVLLRINSKTTARQSGKTLPYYILVRSVAPVEKEVFEDARDGVWNKFDLFSASLIAEGTTDAETLEKYEERLDLIIKKFQREIKSDAGVATQEELTKKVFTLLHGEVLTGKYDINCTNTAAVFRTGNYNCVSATVLFNTIGQRMGLDVCGLEMPGHALSRVKYRTKDFVDLETTCANWFALKDNNSRRAETLNKIAPQSIGFDSEDAEPLDDGTYALRTPNEPGFQNQAEPTTEHVARLAHISKELREVDSVQLVATIYYNKGVDMIKEDRFAEALCLNVKALQLDPNNETVWKHIVAPINNWAIEYAKQKRYSIAAKLLDEGMKIDPGYENFKMNQLHVYYCWIQALGDAKRYTEAETVYVQADIKLPNNPHLKSLIQSIRSEAHTR